MKYDRNKGWKLIKVKESLHVYLNKLRNKEEFESFNDLITRILSKLEELAIKVNQLTNHIYVLSQKSSPSLLVAPMASVRSSMLVRSSGLVQSSRPAGVSFNLDRR